MSIQREFRFDGSDIVPQRDNARLGSQLDRIFSLMRDGKWRSLDEISDATGAPAASVSAQLRNLRKERFGGWQVDRRYLDVGLYQYKLVLGEDVHGFAS